MTDFTKVTLIGGQFKWDDPFLIEDLLTVLVRLPTDYFAPRVARPFMIGWPWPLRWGGLLIKNVLGVLVVMIGVALSLPGIPGQGVLIVLLGLMLLDIPGKRAIAYRVVRLPSVIATINKLRARYGKVPLVVN